MISYVCSEGLHSKYIIQQKGQKAAVQNLNPVGDITYGLVWLIVTAIKVSAIAIDSIITK
jgi:hypothetical protein